MYHGRFGTGTFQIIYRTTRYTPWVYATLLEWHAATALVASLAVAWTPAVAIACIMLCLSLIAAGSAAASALLPRGASWWCRPLVFMLNLVQPAVRSWHRYAYRLFGHRAAGRRISTESTASMTAAPIAGPTLAKRVSWRAFDQYWISRNGRGREQLLDILTESAKSDGWRGDYEAEWAAHDVELWPSPWHVVHISTATEELGQERRFTRARASLHTTLMTKLALALGVLWLTIGLAAWHVWGGIPGVLLLGVLGICVVRDRTIQRRAVRELIAAAGRRAGLQPVNPYPPRLTTEHQLPVTKDRKCGHAANDELLEELAPTT